MPPPNVIEQNSLKARSTRRLPTNRTSRGNTYTSTLFSYLFELDEDDEPEKSTFDTYQTIQTIEMFLYLQDSMVVQWARSHYAASTAPIAVSRSDWHETVNPTGIQLLFDQIATPTQAIDYPQGQVIRANTITGDVSIVGFAGYIPLRSRDMVCDEDHTLCEVSVFIMSQCAVIDGPKSYDSAESLNHDEYHPIILKESDYTQAMRDNGDIIELSNPMVEHSLYYQICGLWAAHSV